MQITLKTTILFSTSLALILNLIQFAGSYQSRQDAFAPSWTHTTPAPSPATVVRANTEPTPVLVASPSPTPAESTETRATQLLQKAGLKTAFAGLYLAAEQQTGTPWELLAAVHHFETHQAGSTTRTSYAGATGPMQFMPATFRAYGVDGDGDGAKNISDLEDAMYSAGRYLAANGANTGSYRNALYRYNHSNTYVSNVFNLAKRLGL